MIKLAERTQNLMWSLLFFIPAGLVCLGYVRLKRDFAKYHIAFSFLDFPVFIGEMLLMFSGVLLVLWWIRTQPAFRPWHLFVGLYVAWLAVKTVTGYMVWGPLALRHAALFYYPLFFVFGFVFFNRDIFNTWGKLLMFGVIAVVLCSRSYDHYWTLTLALLGLVLICETKDVRQRWAMLAVLALVTPYLFMIKTARMMFVANAVSSVFLVGCAWHLSKVKAYIKWTALAVFAFVMLFGFYKFFILGESGRVFVSPGQVMSAFEIMDRDVQKHKHDYEPEPLAVALFHPPNLDSWGYHYYNKDAQQSLHGRIERPKQAHRNILIQEQTFNANLSLVKLVSGKEKYILQQEEVEIIDDDPVAIAPQPETVMPVEWASLNNIVFRLFIWRDMFEDWRDQHSPVFGIDFGRPLRSKSLEILNWCEEEWSRDGWIEPHNSFFHILYRGGVVGLGCVIVILFGLAVFVRQAWQKRSWPLILLAAVGINWLVASNFLLILELPYTAIPFWLIMGMAWAYAYPQNTFKEEKGNA